jgi:peptidoglycan hydrolase CwlO-like protein
MKVFEYLVLIAAGMGTIIICVKMILSSSERKNANDIKPVCKESFDAIEGTNQIRRAACMDIFKQLKDNVQALMLQNKGFEGDIKSLTEKIDELKSDVKEISDFILKDSKKSKRR